MAQQSIFKSLFLTANFKQLYLTRLPVLHQSSAGLKQETKNLIEKLKIPERPKKPLTPYFKFMAEYRSSIAKENPDLVRKITELSKKCSAAWQALDNSKKVGYEQQYRHELEDYTRKYLEYESKLSEEQRTALQIAKEEKLEDRKKRKIRKLYKDTEKPKRPLTSYLIFALEESKKLQKSPLELSTHLKEKWASASVEEKENYKKLALEGKKKYDEDIERWEKKMQESGKEFLVRKSGKFYEAPVPSRLVRKPKKSQENQEEVSGESEKNVGVVNVSEGTEKKQGLFEKVRKIFKS